MAEKVKYSFIIPVYNREAYIVRCLDSIHHQTKQNVSFEVIVVDDGSTDETAKRVQEYPSERIRYFYIPHSNPCMARKKGIEEARGEYLAFVDSDDHIDERYIEILDPYIGKAEIIESGRYHADNSHIYMPYKFNEETPMEHFLRSALKEYPGSLVTRIFNCCLFQKPLDYADYFFYEDYYLLVQLYTRVCRDILDIQQVLYYSEPSVNSLTRSVVDERMLTGIYALESVLKNYGESEKVKKYMKAKLAVSIPGIEGQLYQYNRPVFEKNQEFLRKVFRKYGTWDILRYIGWKSRIKITLYAISPQLFFYVRSCYKKVKKL